MSKLHPSSEEILEGIPTAHWRKCHDCGNEALHADCIAPYVNCRKCKSRDTRPLKNDNANLWLAAGVNPRMASDEQCLEEENDDLKAELEAAIAKWHGTVASHQYCSCGDCKTLHDIVLSLEPPEGERSSCNEQR